MFLYNAGVSCEADPLLFMIVRVCRIFITFAV